MMSEQTIFPPRTMNVISGLKNKKTVQSLRSSAHRLLEGHAPYVALFFCRWLIISQLVFQSKVNSPLGTRILSSEYFTGTPIKFLFRHLRHSLPTCCSALHQRCIWSDSLGYCLEVLIQLGSPQRRARREVQIPLSYESIIFPSSCGLHGKEHKIFSI